MEDIHYVEDNPYRADDWSEKDIAHDIEEEDDDDE